MTTANMKAIKCVEPGKAEVRTVTVPKLRDDYVLVKTKYVGLNPTDWKHVEFLAQSGDTIGCDFTGVIEDVGSNVTGDWKKGDRIAGLIHGGNEIEPEDGAFGGYCMWKGGLGMKIPDKLNEEEAATLGVGVTTVGQALFQHLKLPLPTSGKKAGYPVLIYGGSSATGILAIQYAALAGAEVIAVCSKRNFDTVKQFGATEAFDYKDTDCAEKIREYTSGKLTKAFDCISEGISANICAEAMGPEGGEIIHLNPIEHDRKDVTAKAILCYTATGEQIKKSSFFETPGIPEDLEFARMFWNTTSELFAAGKIRLSPPKVGKDGLNGAIEGMKDMKEGKVSGVKLVYRVDETP